jgi:hypothetical protein
VPEHDEYQDFKGRLRLPGRLCASAAKVRCADSANWQSPTTIAVAFAGWLGKVSTERRNQVGIVPPGPAEASAASLPIAGHRVARRANSAGQKCVGSASLWVQSTQSTLAGLVLAHSERRLVLPEPAGAMKRRDSVILDASAEVAARHSPPSE